MILANQNLDLSRPIVTQVISDSNQVLYTIGDQSFGFFVWKSKSLLCKKLVKVH